MVKSHFKLFIDERPFRRLPLTLKYGLQTGHLSNYRMYVNQFGSTLNVCGIGLGLDIESSPIKSSWDTWKWCMSYTKFVYKRCQGPMQYEWSKLLSHPMNFNDVHQYMCRPSPNLRDVEGKIVFIWFQWKFSTWYFKHFIYLANCLH